MSNDWPMALLLLLVSPAAGSFLAVVVDRLASREAVVAQPSSCRVCNTRLKWRDMVPVLSAIALRGRCRACGAAIPGHLMRIELAAMLAAVLAVALTGSTVEMWVKSLLLWCLIALFYSDLLYFRLPDALTLVLFGLGLTLSWIDPGRGVVGAVGSAAAAVAAFWGIRQGYFLWRGREGLGLGDVKLMAGVGASVGVALVPLVTLLAAGLALLVVALESVLGKSRPTAQTRLPFGSFLAAASAVIIMI